MPTACTVRKNPSSQFWLQNDLRFKGLLRTTRVACNPNLQVVITHASQVCSQHLFGLPPRMYGMQRTQFDHGRLDLLSLVV